MKKLAFVVLTVSAFVFFTDMPHAGSLNDNSVDNSGNNRGNTTTIGDRTIDRSTNATGGTGVGLGGSVGDTSATAFGGKGGKGGSATGGAGGSVGNTSATGGSIGDTSATGGSIGDTSAAIGDTTSQSNNDNRSTVGDTTSQSNNDNRSTVGDTTSQSNNANESKGGDVEFNYTSIDAENVASSAASVLTGFCQNGGSAQSTKGGFSLAGNDLFCDRIRMADYYWVQYERQVRLSVTFQCHKPVTALESRCGKVAKRMIVSLDQAWENTEKANDLLDSGEFSAKVEKAVGPLARIGGIIGMLFLL